MKRCTVKPRSEWKTITKLKIKGHLDCVCILQSLKKIVVTKRSASLHNKRNDLTCCRHSQYVTSGPISQRIIELRYSGIHHPVDASQAYFARRLSRNHVNVNSSMPEPQLLLVYFEWAAFSRYFIRDSSIHQNVKQSKVDSSRPSLGASRFGTEKNFFDRAIIFYNLWCNRWFWNFYRRPQKIPHLDLAA